uniref:NADH-ubiquinone oxidoreductase chain 4L n=1 Tax=Gesiella jameensis TaxID=1960709 RepID=A0A8E7MJF7_9ANNE|nr:NADH dehydrogenase subunit 4L [Gesiella jameensis]
MTQWPLSLLPFCVFITIMTFMIQQKHLLMMLLLLEMMILNLIILSTLSFMMNSNMDLFMILIMLTFGACEAGIGLACMVKMSRMFGNDNINSSSLLW